MNASIVPVQELETDFISRPPRPLFPNVQENQFRSIGPPISGTMETENNIDMHLEQFIDWFNMNWQKRIELTINASQVPSTQTDFPVLVNSIFPSLIGIALDELRFTKSDNLQLEYEIQKFDTLTGELIAWIKMPTISDGDNIRIYYDNPLAVDEQDSAAVWVDYRVAWHLNQTPILGSPSILDSTGNNNSATPTGGVTQVAGKIGNGLNFDGIDGSLTGDIPIGASFYASIWVKSNVVNWNETAFIFSSREPNGFIIHPNLGSKEVDVFVFKTGSGFEKGIEVFPSDITVFHRYGLQFDAVTNTIQTIFDGVITGSVVKVTPRDALSTIGPRIGQDNASGRFGNMVGNHATIHNSLVSADFFTTEFNNQNDSTAFYSIGTEEQFPVLINPMEIEA